MVLQRWQTVYLFIAVVAMALVAIFPAYEPSQTLVATGTEGGMLLVCRIVSAVSALMAFVAICKFKDLKFQSTLCKVVQLLIILSLVLIIVGKQMSAFECDYTLTVAAPILSYICVAFAKNRIASDYHLIHDSDRLR